MAMLRVTCPCGEAREIEDIFAGRTVVCLKCRADLQIPGLPPAPAPAAADADARAPAAPLPTMPPATPTTPVAAPPRDLDAEKHVRAIANCLRLAGLLLALGMCLSDWAFFEAGSRGYSWRRSFGIWEELVGAQSVWGILILILLPSGLAAAFLLAGHFLWQCRSWARGLAIALVAVAARIALFGLEAVGYGAAAGRGGGELGAAFGCTLSLGVLAWCAAAIWMLVRPASSVLFTDAYHAVMARTPGLRPAWETSPLFRIPAGALLIVFLLVFVLMIAMAVGTW